MTMIHLKQIQVFKDGPTINTRRLNGFDITQLVPSDFVTDSPKCTISPLEKDLGDSSNFGQNLSKLFQEQHLALVSSKHFNVRGASKQILGAHPIQNILLKEIDISIDKELISV